MTNGVNLRELILEIRLEITEDGQPSHVVLGQVLAKYQFLPRQDRAFITRVCEGTLDFQIQLDYIIDQFSNVPVEKMKAPIREILRSGVYQLKYMDSVPDSAVCNEAVKLAQRKGFYNLKGFVNGVLRNIARNLDSVKYPPRENLEEYLSVHYSMPMLLVKRWLKEYGKEITEKMFMEFVREHPTTIRCIETRRDREKILESLRSQQVTVEKAPYVENAYYISDYNHILTLDAFLKGDIQVQDVSSMLVSEAANPQKGDYVIDMCAAPGGKTIHMADKMEGYGMVDARDVSEYKVSLIQDNISRIDLINASAKVQDGTRFDEASREKADIVMADVPCSGYGVMGKKPDIKYRISENKEDELVILQRKILHQAVQYVKPGGILMFSTCTISRKENQNNLKWLLENYPLECENLDPYLDEQLHSETTKRGYLQLLPGVHQCDGFFVARLRKKA